MGHVVSVGCRGADFENPTGFYRQVKMIDPANATKYVYAEAVKLFMKHWDGLPVRQLGVSLSQLTNEDQYQISMFDDRDRIRKLERTTDALKQRFGDTIIVRAASISQAGQARDRAARIGGHYK